MFKLLKPLALRAEHASSKLNCSLPDGLCFPGRTKAHSALFMGHKRNYNLGKRKIIHKTWLVLPMLLSYPNSDFSMFIVCTLSHCVCHKGGLYTSPCSGAASPRAGLCMDVAVGSGCQEPPQTQEVPPCRALLAETRLPTLPHQTPAPGSVFSM